MEPNIRLIATYVCIGFSAFFPIVIVGAGLLIVWDIAFKLLETIQPRHVTVNNDPELVSLVDLLKTKIEALELQMSLRR